MKKSMHKPWDRRMKRLFRMVPLDIAKWLFPDATFTGILPNELEDEDDDEVLYTDVLYDFTINGKRVLLHVEFQKRGESKMDERMWKYNVRATIQYGCPVWSCVIYLKARFPKLIRLTKKQGSVIEEPDVLNDLIVKVSLAQTMEEVRHLLLAVDEGEDNL